MPQSFASPPVQPWLANGIFPKCSGAELNDGMVKQSPGPSIAVKISSNPLGNRWVHQPCEPSCNRPGISLHGFPRGDFAYV